MNNIFKSNTIKISLHLLVWTIILGLPLYIFQRWDIAKDFTLVYYIGCIISGIIFYTNFLVLVPKYFFQDTRFRYYLLVLILLIIMYFVSYKSNVLIFSYLHETSSTGQIDRPGRQAGAGRLPMPPRKSDMRIFGRRLPFRVMNLVNYSFTSLFLVFLSIGIRVLERQSQTEKLQKELEKEKLNSELAFLKNQISPHFFFNTLNNIYSLTTSNPEDSRTAILKLSKMMRYLLYDSEDGDTRLSNEIELMINYIGLMKLRLEENYNLKVKFPDEYEDFRIPPLLFIPFIENAFKHGVNFHEDSFIDIFMTAFDNTITFRSFNSISRSAAETGLESSGIGLNNVRKRLDLLFPGKHDLQFNRTESTFEVLLKIQVTS